MTKEIIIPAGSAPYSPDVRSENVVYVSGTLSIDKDRETVGEGDPLIQTRHVLESIKNVIQTAGGGM